MKNLLATAIALASEKHKGQFDKGGMPYILHPLKVMHYLKTDDLQLMAIAVLHDVTEDCGVTYQELLDIGMTIRVANGIMAMTKHSGDSHEQYLSRIKNNPDAIKVKLADLRHNSDIRRLKGVTAKDIARLDKYAKMYNELKDLI